MELLVAEVNFRSERWIICNMYKQPKTPDNLFISKFEKLLCNLTREKANIVISGDFNVKMSYTNNCPIDTLDVNGMRNIVEYPTNMPKRLK